MKNSHDLHPKIKVVYYCDKFDEEENKLSQIINNTDWKNINWSDYLKNKYWKFILWSIISLALIVTLFMSIFIWQDKELTLITSIIDSILIIFFIAAALDMIISPVQVIDICSVSGENINYKANERYKYEEFIIEKYFGDLWGKIHRDNEDEHMRASIWRANHPLEEKCRIALTNNPNGVAELVREVILQLKNSGDITKILDSIE